MCKLIQDEIYRFRNKEEIERDGKDFNLARDWLWLQDHLVKYCGGSSFEVCNDQHTTFYCNAKNYSYYFEPINNISVSKDSLIEFL